MAAKKSGSFADRFDQAVFDAIYARALVYNACWEDPAVDRLALNIGADDTMLVITSAGSAHAAPAYLEQLELRAGGKRLSDHLTFHSDLAAGLQRRDRVHTYAGFHVADVTP